MLDLKRHEKGVPTLYTTQYIERERERERERQAFFCMT
jgi:hypothetical protein